MRKGTATESKTWDSPAPCFPLSVPLHLQRLPDPYLLLSALEEARALQSVHGSLTPLACSASPLFTVWLSSTGGRCTLPRCYLPKWATLPRGGTIYGGKLSPPPSWRSVLSITGRDQVSLWFFPQVILHVAIPCHSPRKGLGCERVSCAARVKEDGQLLTQSSAGAWAIYLAFLDTWLPTILASQSGLCPGAKCWSPLVLEVGETQPVGLILFAMILVNRRLLWVSDFSKFWSSLESSSSRGANPAPGGKSPWIGHLEM